MKRYIKQAFIMELAEFLTERGFRPDEAYKESERFWRKHRKKLDRVLGR